MNLFIDGDPKGQPRPRAFARKMGAKYVARVYDSDVADEWKRAVDRAIIEAVRREGVTINDGSPFAVEMTFYLHRPKSHYRSNGQLRPNAPQFHTQKPDCDNLAKLVLDRITRSELIWRDDSQVSRCEIIKNWAANLAGANLTLRTLEF